MYYMGLYFLHRLLTLKMDGVGLNNLLHKVALAFIEYHEYENIKNRLIFTGPYALIIYLF